MILKSRISKGVFALLCLAILLSVPRAQQTIAPAPAKTSNEDRVALYQALLDLTNPWTVMCIAAHPDDEDGTSLIVMRRKYGAHTVSVFSTFGEGGQNAIGSELYEELGAIRARETMAAAEIQGSEPYFLGLKDFGYSKSADEAFRFWGHEEALRRMVLQIRKLRPDVIITNHSVTNNDHGHHQATARLELEAFDAAADPKRFPEQLKDGVTVWQVQRLFVRAGRSNQAQADTAGVISIDPNERDPIRDTTFAEEALRALQKHATQGPWPKTLAEMARFRNSPDGKLPLIRYVLVREAKGIGAVPRDSHNFLEGLRLAEEIAKQIPTPAIEGHLLTDFVDVPQRLAQSLVSAVESLPKVREGQGGYDPRFLFMRKRLLHTLALASGVAVSIVPADKLLVPGLSTELVINISNNGSRPIRPYLLDLNGSAVGLDANSRLPLFPGKSLAAKGRFATPNNANVNVPHYQHLYDGRLFGEELEATAYMQIEGTSITVPDEVAMDVGPAMEIANISPSPIVRTPAATKTKLTSAAQCIYRDSDFNLRLTNNQDLPFSGELVTGSAARRRTGSRKLTIGPHESVNVVASVSGCVPWVDSKNGDTKAAAVSFTLMKNGAPKPVARLDVPVVWAAARVAPNLRVGYVRGFDYSLPNALAALGVESKELAVDDVRSGDLQKYSAIIIDNRVYESQPGLIAANQRLLDYAKDGGTLIVFYHKSFEWNPDPRRNRPQLAPYPITLGDERITDETAPITFIAPQHPLLNFPNKIGQEDFAGWIQERGLYYPKDWDAHYRALLASNDPGEAPLRGGLLAADYGRGHYIYTSMVWYRQLRAGVPGAYRMLANMISYGRPAR